MVTSNKGIELIKKFEGCILKAYKDAVGVWTIGYGHTSGVTPKMVITKDEATELLKADLYHFEQVVENIATACNYVFNQNEFDALVSFTFNCGGSNLKKLVANGSRTKEQIAASLLKYNKAGGAVLRGLTRRREAEQKLFNGL